MTAALRLATRGSRQAMAQATIVADAIRAVTTRSVEIVEIQTTGDLRLDVPLHVIGGQGVFVKEVQRALLDGRADLAVHSAKDLPSATTEGLTIAAFCERRDPADALVGKKLVELSEGATVATGSVRRRAQLTQARPDLNFVELRGNIDSRLSKIPADGAIVMAVAALQILGMADKVAEVLPPADFVPAVGQGCVAVECRGNDADTLSALQPINHEQTRRDVEVERAFLAELGSGCSLPVGAYVTEGVLRTFLADSDNGRTTSDEIILTGTEADLETARLAAQASLRAVE